MARFFRRRKKTVFVAVGVAIFITIASVLAFRLISGGHFLGIDRVVLTGNQIGDLSLVHIPSGEVLQSKNVKDYSMTDMTSPIERSSYYVNMDAVHPKEQPLIFGEFEEEAPEEVVLPTTNRNLEKVGEVDGYLVVAGTIEKGDYWLKVQKEIMPSTDPTTLLPLGKKVNPNGRVHPIYPKERVLFLYKGDFPDIEKGDEVTVQKEVDPQDVKPQDEDVSHKDVVVSDYFYQFSEDGFYVLDNLKSCVYEIIVDDGTLDLIPIASLGGGMVADRFVVSGDVLYFSIAQNDIIYVVREGYMDKVYAPAPQEVWGAAGDDLYFTMDMSLYHVDLAAGKHKEVYLGERSSDIFVTKDCVYLSNDFGYNNFKSVVHYFGKDLSSRGWAEIYYSIDSQIAAVDDYMILNQNMQNENSKIVFINPDLRVEREKDLDELFPSLALDGDLLYGMKDRTLYLYNLSGKRIADFQIGGTNAYLLN